MTRRAIALLLCGSGFCALIYQIAWLRELRLVFGASTPASAAVLAVFMGGLGWGSLRLSKRADRVAKPLKMYADLELLIALTAAVTPLLLMLVRSAYVALGGTTSLGIVGGTLVRLLGSALVLLPPTFLMGGTLPAAARAAESEGDVDRTSTALLYGANTVGAVLGAALATFVLLEIFGTRLTLWLGCTINAAVAIIARGLDRRLEALEPEPGEAGEAPQASLSEKFVYAAALGVGLSFLLLELVWYRVLAPLLGGSTYTFGLILAVALLGVGVGGLLYTLRGSGKRPTLVAFAGTCGLEALFVALPLWAGDALALFALSLRPLGAVGLWGHAVGWTIVTAIVVLPAAIVAGYQFPLLIALLGRGRENVGRHVGLAYAFNTGGAIIGSLAGGFILIPWLTAVGSWRLCGVLLALIGVGALAVERAKTSRALFPSLVIAGALLLAALPDGPTAVWRHSPIGTGRADYVSQYRTRNELRRWTREQMYAVTWEVDGRESSIALQTLRDTAFLVNGKSDGSSITDATTQVMSGILGALLHGDVKTTMVIGLGTGSTAGWLGLLPDVERVDVVEIEPAIEHVARVMAPVNGNVMDNPKVHHFDGDAREVLLTTPHRYDLVFSEPSNPYRAGIASLFTQEFYQAVKSRLEPGGVFVQWVQGYEIDVESVRTVYATLTSVFGSVASWRTDVTDLVLIARDTDGEPPIDVEKTRALVKQQPYRDALLKVWRVHSLEGVLAHHVASPQLATIIGGRGDSGAHINTDNRNLLEFAVARALGRTSGFSVGELHDVARDKGLDAPAVSNGEVSWPSVRDQRLAIAMAHNGEPPKLEVRLSGPPAHRYAALKAWANNDPAAVVEAWQSVGEPVRSPMELMVIADSLALMRKSEELAPALGHLRKLMPTEADAIDARHAWALEDHDATMAALTRALTAFRSDPWPCGELMMRTLRLAPALAMHNDKFVAPVIALLSQPFATNALRYWRERYRFEVSMRSDDPSQCVQALVPFEPHTPWDRHFLGLRAECYSRAVHARAELARSELNLFIADSATPIRGGLVE